MEWLQVHLCCSSTALRGFVYSRAQPTSPPLSSLTMNWVREAISWNKYHTRKNTLVCSSWCNYTNNCQHNSSEKQETLSQSLQSFVFFFSTPQTPREHKNTFNHITPCCLPMSFTHISRTMTRSPITNS